MRDLLPDSLYALRTLRKSPGFATVATLTLALGIGANSAIFSFVDGVLLKALPYTRADRIVLVWERPPGFDRNVISALNFLDWQKENTVFEHIAATTGGSLTLSGREEPVQLRAGRVSASYFEIFGVKPVLGRTFAPDEDQPGKELVVVLSHDLWATQFGSDAGIIGRSITLDGQPYTVIGIMPEGSSFDRGFARLWRPLAFSPDERTRDFHWLVAYGRLKPGVTLEEARAQMDGIAARIARDFPNSNKGWGVAIERYADGIVGSQLRQSLFVLLAAVGMLLLIGCANLANLALARGSSREREVAVRAALGAGRGRLVRQFLTENVLLSVAGGLAGLFLGYALLTWLKRALPPFTLPRDAVVAMDSRVLAFTLLLSVATGIVFGLAPALHATRPDLSAAMKEGGRGTSSDRSRRQLRNVLVVVEMALAFMLLVGSGLLVRSFFRMMNVELGFDATNVLTMQLPIASDRFASPSALTQYVRELEARIGVVPGVRGVAVADALPLEGWNNGMPFLIAGREVINPANRPSCGVKMVSPGYLQTLGMRVIKGRGLSERDVKGAPPAIVINQSMEARYFAGQNPIGQRILIQEVAPGKPQLGPEIAWEVVGVVADERTGSLDGTQRPGAYVSIEQSPTTSIGVVIRSTLDPASLERAIIRAVHDVDPNQAVADVRTLEQIKSESTASNRLRTILLAGFAVLAVLLSAIGIYGVISYAVVQRTHEIGIRAALGANAGMLMRLVLRNGMALAGLGLVLGFLGALGLTRLLSTLLFGVSPRDPLTITGAAGMLAAVALVACYVPARRAARLDPLIALRDE